MDRYGQNRCLVRLKRRFHLYMRTKGVSRWYLTTKWSAKEEVGGGSERTSPETGSRIFNVLSTEVTKILRS